MSLTQYTHSSTIAVPAPLIPDANHLALLLGESSADIETFKQPSYTDGATEYAVAHAVVKPVFLTPHADRRAARDTAPCRGAAGP